MGDEINVLVVDEDPEVLDLTRTFLERNSERIDAATEESAGEVLEIVGDGEFDAVVSDFKMPEMDGIELFEKVREHRPEMPFFLFTAKDSKEFDERAAAAGVTGFVRKGVGTEHYEELAADIEAAFE